MKREKKVFNLADKKEILELMKQLYGSDDVKDERNIGNTERIYGASGVGNLAKISPDSEKLLSQE